MFEQHICLKSGAGSIRKYKLSLWTRIHTQGFHRRARTSGASGSRDPTRLVDLQAVCVFFFSRPDHLSLPFPYSLFTSVCCRWNAKRRRVICKGFAGYAIDIYLVVYREEVSLKSKNYRRKCHSLAPLTLSGSCPWKCLDL